MKANKNHLGIVPSPRLARSLRREGARPGVMAGLLGLVCVIALFGALGLLYAMG